MKRGVGREAYYLHRIATCLISAAAFLLQSTTSNERLSFFYPFRWEFTAAATTRFLREIIAANTELSRPVRLAYQPPASSTFLSEQTSHQQPANSTFLSEQISTSHQPPAERTD
jgi:multisubunit Na+/H+ antiporter MnhE subunit